MKCEPRKVSQIAEIIGAAIIGDPATVIEGFSSVEEATTGDVVYAEKRRVLKKAIEGPAACIVVSEAPENSQRTFLVFGQPRLAFTRIVRYLAPPAMPKPGIHPSAVVSDTSMVGAQVHIGPFVVVEDDTQIGEGSVILANSYVGRGCSVGRDCTVGPHAVLYPGVHLGDRVLVQAGTVLGSDGFGYILDEKKNYLKIPQLGTVVIEDDVEIGSNTSIDRATLGQTRIGKDSKIDNLVQIAHNVAVGAHTAVSGQTGIAGSTKVGDYCILAGQVGVGDHVTIEDQVIVGAQAGIPTGKRMRSNQIVWGSPAKPVDEWKRMLSILSRLAKQKKE